jgi:hypothetical protein
MAITISGTDGVGVTGNVGALTAGTAVTASGTSIDFTGIPSWVKRITVMLNNISLSGTALPIIQIGAGAIETTGYVAYASYNGTSNGATATTTFFPTRAGGGIAADTIYGIATIALIGSNTWAYSFCGGMFSGANYGSLGGGAKTTSGTLDRVRLTSSNGTDTFDAGSINILFE